MVINLYDYTGDNILGKLSPIECTITDSLSAFSQVYIKISAEDYILNKSVITTYNTVCLKNAPDSTQDGKLYLITRINATNQYAEIEAKHILYAAKNGYCNYWNYTPTTCWFIQGLVNALNHGWHRDAPSYILFDNVTNSVPHAASYSFAVDPNCTQETRNIETNDVDWFSKSITEIINDVCERFNVVPFYSQYTIYFTDNVQAFAGDLQNVYYREGKNITELTTTTNWDNFTSAVVPFASVEKRDRFNTDTEVQQLSTKYNTWFSQSGHSQSDLERHLEVKTFTSPIKWDRNIIGETNIYFHHHDREREIFTEHWNSLLSSSSPYLEICNLLGEAIGRADCSINGFDSSHRSSIFKYDALKQPTSITIGWVQYTILSEDDIQIEIIILSDEYGNYNLDPGFTSLIYGDIPMDNIKVYSPTKKELGIVSTISTTEGSTVQVNIERIDTDENDNDVRTIIGHAIFSFSEPYWSYYNDFVANIEAQAQVYADSFTDAMLENLSCQIQPFFAEHSLIPGCTITVISNIYNFKTSLWLSQIKYDWITKRYIEFQTGFKRGNLRDLGMRF